MTVAVERLLGEIEQLAKFSSAVPPAVTRVLFSPEDLAAREYVKSLAREAGFSVRVDAVGNTFIRWDGLDPGLPAVATGSHVDAIPNAGKFDGVVGVLGGLEAIRTLVRSGFRPRASIELILFTAEEPTRFGIGCLGSRLLSGALAASEAEELRDADGKCLREWLTGARFSEASLESVKMAAGTYAAFIELHIEQGPTLEASGVNIGIVEKIAAPAAFRFVLEGEGGHAGAVLMPGRRDAGLGGAEIALAVEQAVKSHGSPDGVGTTGVFRIEPGAINSIPCRAWLEVDVRDTDHGAREAVEREILSRVEEISARRGLRHEVTTINSDPPVVCSAVVIAAIESACDGMSSMRMVSRAYHDTLFMGRVAPVSMIFIPCFKGYSHRPDEFASAEDIARGVSVLAKTLATLAGGEGKS